MCSSHLNPSNKFGRYRTFSLVILVVVLLVGWSGLKRLLPAFQ